MKKNSIIILTLVLIGFSSCVTNEPTTYTTWHCVEVSPALGSPRTYLVDMYRERKDTTLYLLSNFHKISIEGDYDVAVKIINKKLTFERLREPIGNSLYRINSGSGTVNSDFTQMEINYNIYDGSSEISVQATYTR